MGAEKIIFVTGTDTGVGKTLLTALLLFHLRQRPGRTLAMKPFCSGGLDDVRLLQSLQPGELSDTEMNPFYFEQPVAPLAAVKRRQKPVRINAVVDAIRSVQAKCDQLLIEGSGGLMVPLGQGYTVADLIAKLDCCVVIVARNRLGTINHTLLSVHALKANGIKANKMTVVLMDVRKPDLSARRNAGLISRFVKPILVLSIPFLGSRLLSAQAVAKNYPKIYKTIGKLVEFSG
jgi:dethiobiotin synthetase